MMSPGTELEPPRELARRFWVRLPPSILLVALAAAALHMLPWWHAQSVTPPDWTFTGNVTVSPDAMQYRVWMRQALEQGLVVDDRFTSEPSRPFLPVSYYWGVGQLARAVGSSPEWTSAWLGVPLAAALALLVYLTARFFLGDRRMAWWVSLAVLFGGGWTAHLRLLRRVPGVRSLPVVDGLIESAFRGDAPSFEDSRFHYVIRTLFDTHFLLIWLWTLAAVLCLYFALRRPAAWRSALTALLFAGLTLIHVYEAVTLLAIAGSVPLFLWRKQLPVRPALATLALGALGVGACLAWLFSLQRSSGLPFPPWKAPSFPVANIALAFPVAWALIAIGLAGYWRRAGLEECFLLGWALACTLILLSHPYYPYHDRGAVSLQIVVHVIASAIWLQRFGALTPRAILVGILLFGAAPLYVTKFLWDATHFDTSVPWLFQSPEDRELVARLARATRGDDVLLAPDRDYRWLYPEYPGRSYDAHFFLTVDFERKQEDKRRFFEADPAEQLTFLQRERIRFLYIDKGRDPDRFAALPGLAPLYQGVRGSLFEVELGAREEPR